ncbi:MAG: dUTP diphosphatase [Planctomycetota bacterium]
MSQQPSPTTPLNIPIQRLSHAEDLPLPAAQSEHAAGLDLCAAIPAETPIVLQPGEINLVPTGFAIAVPVGYEAQVRPRSGLATKHGISMPNTPGTIDADYRGEIRVPLINLGRQPVPITRGMRIAQMLIKPVPPVRLVETDTLPPTARGTAGFGSTGQ